MSYWLPTIPLKPIDLINRRAAATGSIRFAQLAEHGDYNGHRIGVTFKPHAVSGPIWNAEYWWAGRIVIARGSLRHCLEAAKREYEKAARGTSVHLIAPDPDAPEGLEEQEALAKEFGFEPEPERVEGAKPEYWTGKHEAVSDALDWAPYGFGGMVERALDFEGSPEEWPAVREAWLDERRRAQDERRKSRGEVAR